MSLSSVYAGIAAGCVAVPQHGFFSTEPAGKFAISWQTGNLRGFYAWTDDVVFDWICPSPPAVVSVKVYEKPPAGSATDPIFEFGCYLTSCASPGFALGTSDWFTCVFPAYHFYGAADRVPDWVHFSNYKSAVGSIGLVRSGVSFPVA